MSSCHASLFEAPRPVVDLVKPWRPHALTHEQWPPDYKAVYAWRMATLAQLQADPEMFRSAEAYYSSRPAEFIMHWMDTYNPRIVGSSKWIPFIFFKRQADFIDFIEGLRHESQSGLVEKCRDIGATWLACAYSVWSWRFLKDDATGWGSRKQELVHKIGDPDSIFEKMFLLLRRMPSIWLPKGFNPRDHATFMKLINPVNGSTVTGEAGNNIGRGGRKARYWKDEAQPLTAGILTPFGWQTMGEMVVGSIVCGPKGDWRQVTHINEVGEAPCYRVTFRDGTSTECSENHLWTVQHFRTGKTETLRTVELFETYRYSAPGGQVKYIWRLPEMQSVEFVPQGEMPLDPYLVGALLGDGCVSGVPHYRPTLTSADDEIAEQFRTLLPADCKITKGVRYSYQLGDADGRRGQGKVSRMSLRIMQAGIAGCRAENKFIPDRYKFASSEQRLALLQGLMDTDGSASGKCNTFQTSSKRLADDVRFVVQSLGGVASLNVKPDKRGFLDQYVLHIGLNLPLFRLTRKLEQASKRQKQMVKTIMKIEPIGSKPVRCITLNHDDGIYLTDHCIQTHNSAHYQHAEMIEASLGDNTNVQIDISSVNGLGNVFHRRREAGVVWTPGCEIEKGYTRVFIFDWRHHPEKDQEWYDTRRAKFEREGMLHIFAQEVDRDYAASVENTVIPLEYINACVDAHLIIPQLRQPPPDIWSSSLDVAEEGLDRNAYADRQWVILRDVVEWGARDPGVTAREAISRAQARQSQMRQVMEVQYDCIGVGVNVKSEYNRLVDEKVVDPAKVKFIKWNAGAAVVNPYAHIIEDDEESPTNKAFFHNFKAQAWWALRTRCYKTFKCIEAIKKGLPVPDYSPDELFSIDGSIKLLEQLKKELAQPTTTKAKDLRVMIDKTPDGTKSPNLADAVVMVMFPAPDTGGRAVSTGYSV